MGFGDLRANTSLFISRTSTSMIMMLIYVDDILITRLNSVDLKSLNVNFSVAFPLNDLGKLFYFLGIEVLYDADRGYLSQKKYIKDLLSKFDMLGCKGIDTPMSTNLKLQKEAQWVIGDYIVDLAYYRSIVRGM